MAQRPGRGGRIVTLRQQTQPQVCGHACEFPVQITLWARMGMDTSSGLSGRQTMAWRGHHSIGRRPCRQCIFLPAAIRIDPQPVHRAGQKILIRQMLAFAGLEAPFWMKAIVLALTGVTLCSLS